MYFYWSLFVCLFVFLLVNVCLFVCISIGHSLSVCLYFYWSMFVCLYVYKASNPSWTYILFCVVLKHIVAGLQCVSDNKSSLDWMLLLEYNSNPTNIQITNINTVFFSQLIASVRSNFQNPCNFNKN
jgi:galactitol-specific phosphotransferase system IIC component